MSPATTALAALAVLVFIGLGLEVLQRRTGIPDALVLLFLGVLARQLGWLDVETLGGLVPIFTTSALVLLLFESAIDMRLADLRGAAANTLRLTVVSYVFSALIVAGVAILVLQLPLLHALLLGSILGGTSTSVVVPLTRGLGLGRDTQLVLTLESTLNDALCVVGALAMLGLALGQQSAPGALASALVRDVGGALVVGLGAGIGVALSLRALRPHRLPWMFLLAALFLVYAAAERLTGQGAIACLALGVMLGNAPELLGSIQSRSEPLGPAGLREADRGFVQETAFLMKLLFFVYLGASFRVTDLGGLLMGALAAAAILLLARPLATRLSLSVKRASRRDAMVCAVIAPKGLAAAVLATLPAQRGLPGGERIATVVAAGVVVSIVASSLLSVFAARPRGLLGLRQLFSRYPEAIDGKAAVESPEEEPSAV